LASILTILSFRERFEPVISRMSRLVSASPAVNQDTALLLNEIKNRAGSNHAFFSFSASTRCRNRSCSCWSCWRCVMNSSSVMRSRNRSPVRFSRLRDVAFSAFSRETRPLC